MLDGLFLAPAVSAIGEALASAHADGKLGVVGSAALFAALGKAHKARREVVAFGLSARAAKKVPGALTSPDEVEPGSLAAVIGVDVSRDDAWEATLRSWSRAVRDGGAIVLVDRGSAKRTVEISRRALCAGLAEIEQRQAGRAVVTSGLVSHL